ncbi:TIGR01777 family oxidoreductase [Cellulomonas endophytica]|uniref:TIGR01777 family oxidoreductase n=1 Tax=Cellulomonas endophytica TaxID=2494735 RepID=UPI0010136FC7|nr:TIGR01777 family oxidoreductase [Cellulomonas endophytica]
MRVVVAGSHGLIGSALVPRLRGAGHAVRTLVRGHAAGPDEAPWDPDAGHLDPAVLEDADAVVCLSGVNVGERYLTPSRKRLVVRSRVSTAGLLARTLAGLADPGSRVLLQASGIGAYGDRGDTPLTESEPLGDTFFADVVRQWEAASEPAQDAGVRVALLRTGIVLAPDGGALGRLLPLLRAGLGGPLGSGRQYWSWITLVDEVRAIEHLLTADVSGPVNMVTDATRNAELTAELARALHRPSLVPAPAWALRLVLGDFSSEVLGSQRAVPEVLRSSGFVPEHADAATAARWVATAG